MKYTFPVASVATAEARPMGAFTAAMGVGGGAPPANVEIRYCCAHAAVPLAKRTPNPAKALNFIYPPISFSIALGFARLFSIAQICVENFRDAVTGLRVCTPLPPGSGSVRSCQFLRRVFPSQALQGSRICSA